MQRFESNKRDSVQDIISLVKVLSLFFCAIAFFSSIDIFNDTSIVDAIRNNGIITFCLFSGIVIIILQMYIFFAGKSVKHTLTRNIVEIVLFVFIFTLVNIMVGESATQYKFLYLFIIITSTIQLGINYGMPVAVASSVFVLGIDIAHFNSNSVNQYFQNDLILVGVFMLTAWLLGYYVKVEKEYSAHMYDLANVDELTEVYNHRYFHDALNNALEVAGKSGGSLYLLLMDIDSFKNYNDLYGHTTGDDILKKVGSIIYGIVGLAGTVARYGGEEFAVILPDTDEEKAFEIAEAIRKTIEETGFQDDSHLGSGKLTISIGISGFPQRAMTKEDLINNADEALYRAKYLGKNRVEGYISILEEMKMEIEDRHYDLISSIKTLINLINLRDRYTYGHTERVVILCELLGNELNLSSEDKKILKFGAYLHDIGKVQISKKILNKKMPLTAEEWSIVRLHPENGAETIRPVRSLAKVVPLILHHHENYDGTGYPTGLRGEQIPYLVRVLTVADSVDAMTSNRPYKPSKTLEEVIEELLFYSGTQFDPEVANAMITVLNSKLKNQVGI